MKAHLIRFTISPIENLRGILASVVATVTLFNLLPKANAQLFWEGADFTPATAGFGTWTTVSFSGTGIWSTSQTTNTNGPWIDGSDAHFLGSAGGDVTLATNITAASITFDSVANTFPINTNGNVLTIDGAGVVNNSGKTQTITNNGTFLPPEGAQVPAGVTIFSNSATAGNVVINNDGGAVTNGAGGITEFTLTSTAGNAAINNNGGTVSGATGGATDFLGNSTAGNATITNNGGEVSGATGGITDFTQNSSAGNATIINNGSTISGVVGGITGFSDASTAGSATITNNGGAVSGATGGNTEFLQTTTAGSAAITNNGGTASGAGGGITGFSNSSTAANATITNNGGKVGGAAGGVTAFTDTATAANASITNNGGTVSGANGGSTLFTSTSTAGNATITNNGGSTAGANGGSTEFGNTSTAGSATITANGGTGGGTGGSILFLNSSDGGTARAITNGNGSLDISGLTSAGMGIGSIEGSGNYFLGSKSLTVGGNNLSTTVSGVIQDGGFSGGTGGSITKIGTGTLTLTGDNTYSGGTTISAGTLQIGNGGTTGSITGNVLDNGVLAFNRSDSVTFGAVISGTGSLTQAGAGVTILTGNNSYSGGTTINAGTLQLGNGGTTGSITGNVVDNGTLTFDRSDSVTFAGVVSGTGSLTQAGSGVTILTGKNSYTGGTTISAGTLQIGNGGTTGSITGNVLDNGVLAFNRSDSVTFGGVISGTGSLVKQGTGTLTLPGANPYTGTTTINAGSLIVDGSIASQQTFVNGGAFLGGRGTIGGNLSNSGMVGPGDSPGTLTVSNNYVQTSAGTLRIQIGGLAANQHDLLAVNGHVTLGGTLHIVRLGNFTLQPGNQVVFLTAQQGISGTFNTVQNDFATGTTVKGTLIISGNELQLTGQQSSFTTLPGVTLTPNQLAVANMLNSAVGDPRAAALIAFLNSQPVANLPHDYDLIAPTQITSINATAVSVGRVQVSNISGRLANIHAGSTGFSSAGFALSGAASSAGGFAGVSGPEGKSGPPVFASTPSNRWGVFLTGLGEFTNVDSTSTAPGYDVNTGGFTLGVDYRVTPNFAIGLTAGYAHTSVGIDSPGGSIDVNAGKIGMYATIFGNGFYLDAAVSGGPSGYTTRRTALQGTANGSTNGGDVDILVAGGYDWQKGNLTIGPTASFQFSYVGLSSFTETGSLAPLQFPDQNTESERTAFGAKATYEWKAGGITVLPQVSAAWQHEFGSTEYSVVASLASGAGNTFSVSGPHIGRDSILVGAGATFILNERVSTYIYYDGEFARTNYLSNNVSGGVRISF
jgi:autotransporter-associated beta strand protein